MRIGFIFNNDHVWSTEELIDLQEIIAQYNWDNYMVGTIVYISSLSNIIYHDFRITRKDEHVIILREI